MKMAVLKSLYLVAMIIVFVVSTGAQESALDDEMVKNFEDGELLRVDAKNFFDDVEVPESVKVSFNATVQALMSAGEERSLQADGKKARSLFSKSCCMVKVPPEISQNKETVSFVGSEYYSIKSYHSCGFLWSRRCTRYRLRTRSFQKYRQDITYVANPRPCPEEKLNCCVGRVFWMNKECLASPDLKRKLVQSLQDAVKITGKSPTPEKWRKVMTRLETFL